MTCLMVFGGELRVVEIEVRKTEPDRVTADTTNLNVNEIIGKIRTFVDSIRDMSANGEPMTVSLEGFNVNVGKEHDEYEFALKLSLVFKPKAA
jgi:hypothetical protein